MKRSTWPSRVAVPTGHLSPHLATPAPSRRATSSNTWWTAESPGLFKSICSLLSYRTPPLWASLLKVLTQGPLGEMADSSPWCRRNKRVKLCIFSKLEMLLSVSPKTITKDQLFPEELRLTAALSRQSRWARPEGSCTWWRRGLCEPWPPAGRGSGPSTHRRHHWWHPWKWGCSVNRGTPSTPGHWPRFSRGPPPSHLLQCQETGAREVCAQLRSTFCIRGRKENPTKSTW